MESEDLKTAKVEGVIGVRGVSDLLEGLSGICSFTTLNYNIRRDNTRAIL